MTTDTKRAGLITRLRQAVETHQTVYEDDRYRKALFSEAAAYIEPHPPVDAAVERDAKRWRYIAHKLCLTGNGDGTCAMQAINLPEAIQGWPAPGEVGEFCGLAIDAALTTQQQDVPPSPMSKMAEALRQKSAVERADYKNRRQAGEWGPMPEAGTEADFCLSCGGTGWDGESRTDVCPTCNGGRKPIPAAQQQESGS